MNVNIYLPDELGERVKKADLEISRICQAALAREADIYDAKRARMKKAKFDRIEVEVGNPTKGQIVTKAFQGQWLVRDFEFPFHAGVEGLKWSVALTQRGKLAVYYQLGPKGQKGLEVKESLETLVRESEGEGEELPDALVTEIAAALGIGRVIEMDI